MVEEIIHLITSLTVLIPVYLIITILRKESAELTKSLLWTMIGFLPLSTYHFLEFLYYLNIKLIPPIGSLSRELLEHTAVIIAILSFSWFLLFFKRTYIDQIYGKSK